MNAPAKGPANRPDYCCKGTWLLLQKNLITTAVMGPGYCYNRTWALLQKHLTTAATEPGFYRTWVLLQKNLTITAATGPGYYMTWLLLQKKKGVPCLRVGLALQHAEVLEEELHALAGLLHDGAIDTGHARLQCHHPTVKSHSCTAFAYATGTCSCNMYMNMQQIHEIGN